MDPVVIFVAALAGIAILVGLITALTGKPVIPNTISRFPRYVPATQRDQRLIGLVEIFIGLSLGLQALNDVGFRPAVLIAAVVCFALSVVSFLLIRRRDTKTGEIVPGWHFYGRHRPG